MKENSMGESKAVVITTSHRGVFFGYLEKEEGTTVTLTKARNCIYWSSDVRGFVGLSVTGPTGDCKIGPAAQRIKLHDVTSILDASDKAVEAWEGK